MNISLLRRIRAIVVMAVFAQAGHAAIVSGTVTGGQAATDGGAFVQLTDPIGDIGNNAFDDDNLRAFDEGQALTLTGNLIVDAVPAGTTTLVIGAGSVVSSHYVIFDPAVTKDVVATITFDQPVVGVLRSATSHNATDGLLGNPTATYTIGNSGLENIDTVVISGSTMDIDFSTSTPGDVVRVLTSNAVELGFNACGGADQTLTGAVTGGSAFTNGGTFRQICDPIGDVGNDNFQSFDLLAFEEQRAVTLQQDLDIGGAEVIPAGATVSSFYVVFDPAPTTRVIGTVTFPGTIAAIIRDLGPLGASDFLGDATANYLEPNLRGLEGGDTATGVGTNELSVNFSAESPGDVVRVIVSTTPAELPINVCSEDAATLGGSVTGGAAAGLGGIFVELCEPIGTVGNDNYQTNDLYAFRESTNVVLEEPLAVDEGAGATLPTGTVVTSYYVAFDPGSVTTLQGAIEFPGPIVGVMTSLANLNASDFLGNPTATYLAASLRGLEAVDDVSVTGSTLSVSFEAGTPGDYIRVLVAGGSAARLPLPLAALAAAALAIVFTGLWLRRAT